jgi:hypothetical protein
VVIKVHKIHVFLSKDLLIKKVSMFDGSAKYEAWIYSVGALKLLSGNSVVRKTIVNSGCIEALGTILRNIVQQVKLSILKKYCGATYVNVFTLSKVFISLPEQF